MVFIELVFDMKMKKFLIFALAAACLAAAPGVSAQKRAKKGGARKTVQTAASSGLRVYEAVGSSCANYTIAVKGNQAWGWNLERSVGYVGIGISNVTSNSMVIDGFDEYCKAGSGKATITAAAITLGKTRMKVAPRSTFRVYTDGNWALLLNPGQYDDQALIYNTSNPSTFYRLSIEGFSSNGFAITHVSKMSKTQYGMEFVDDYDCDPPTYVMASGDGFELMDSRIVGRSLSLTRVK